jgi:hypothetical protein
MHIVLHHIPVFVLTCEEEGGSRRNHITSLFSEEKQPVSFIHPLMGIAKNKSGASGFSRMIEKGLRMQDRSTPFRPFLMLEDDISFSDGLKEIDVPEDADILYVGLSVCSMNDHRFHYANYYESVEGFPNVVRVKHMLASHGIMVCSALGAAVLQRTMLEVYLSDTAWDIPLAFIQPYYKVYALRRPWVYQDVAYGGDEACTRITLEGGDHRLPEEWVNGDLATIRMIKG